MEEKTADIDLTEMQAVAEDSEALEKAYIREGIKIGILDVARKMLAKDMDIALISELTGYSVAKIKTLKEILSE